MNPTRDWTKFIPPWETQYSATTHTDADSCVSESLCHIVFMLTGRRYSPRALAKMSNTTHSGNNTANVLNSANQLGLIPYDLWPTPDSFDWNTYYAPIPPEILAKAEKLDLAFHPADLSVSPLWTELSFPNSEHMVAQINDSQYFDSEVGAAIKPLNYLGAKVVYQTSIKVNKPPMNPQIATQELNGELRLVLKCSNMDQWNAICAVYGADPANIQEHVQPK